MEGFYSHHEPLLAGLNGCTNLAYEFECSTSSPPLSMAMAMEQLQGSFPPSFGIGAEGAGGGGDKGRGRMVSTERSSTSSAQELAESGSSSRKNKRRSNTNLNSLKGKRASRGQGEDAKVEEEVAATGYIHVRSRRGQATDSHSVAERLRREKINEKMKMLQSLVPGCDKLAGKALLDEIIGYVQSLQNQVEFLSMKLAFLNPTMLHEMGLDIGSACHPVAPRVLKPPELPPHAEAVQRMGQATAAASLACSQAVVPTGATAAVAQDVTQMQSQVQQEEEDELRNCMTMGLFQQ